MRIVHRYAAREFAGPFLAAVFGVTVMLLGGMLFELTDLIVDKKMEVKTVALMLVYRLPGVVVLTLPIAVLFGTLLSLGRLAKDSELTVLLSTGTPFRKVAAPILLLAALVSAACFFLNEWVVPASNHRAETLFRRALFRDPLPAVQEGIFFKGGDDRVFYVDKVDRRSRTMTHILIYQLGNGPFPEIIAAARGRYEERVWFLEEGVRRRFDEEGFTVEEYWFESLSYPMAESLEVYLGNQRTTDEMTRKELGEHIRLFKRSGLDVKRLEVDYHAKAALPLAGFMWALVGAPLSIRAARSGRMFGVVASIVLALAYYVLASLFRSLGGNGIVQPWLAAWTANLVYAAGGLALLYRADRI
ncbi:MAG: LptF/LptG family permease [Clostridia bacterium]|nr:YjgP/YjgQ family permease [Bacillota bacterium]